MSTIWCSSVSTFFFAKTYYSVIHVACMQNEVAKPNGSESISGYSYRCSKMSDEYDNCRYVLLVLHVIISFLS